MDTDPLSLFIIGVAALITLISGIAIWCEFRKGPPHDA